MADMISVNSSLIKAVGYDDLAGELIILFKCRESYAYKVSSAAFDALLDAGSPGRYFIDNIRGQVPHRKL